MMYSIKNSRIIPIFVGIILALFSGCEKDKNPLDRLKPSEAKPTGKREYGEIKPVILPIPPVAAQVLGGTDVSDKALTEVPVYFRVMALVVYRDTFDVKDYVDRIFVALNILWATPEYTKEADSWSIQMQARRTRKFVTITCTPKQVSAFAKDHNIATLFGECDYMMINDLIVIKPAERMDYYNGRLPPPEATQGTPAQ